MLKKIALSLVGIILLLIILVQLGFYFKTNKIYALNSFEIDQEIQNADIELGKRIYMVRSGCIDCHGSDLAGAKIMENGPIGSIYGANITPYKLKNWTNFEIAKAIRYGLHKSNRSLNFMPSFDYQSLSKTDIAALIKFIRFVPEVQKESHLNSFGPIAKVSTVLGKMPVMLPADFINFNKGFEMKPSETVSIEFGKYLANSCIGCHGNEMVGGKIPGGDPSWPEAANIRFGSNSKWNKEVFTKFVKTGISPTTNLAARPPMPIWLLKEFNDLEVDSLWLYLSSLK